MWPRGDQTRRKLVAVPVRAVLAATGMRDALRIVAVITRMRGPSRVQRPARARSNRRRRHRLEIIGAYARCCDDAGTADLVRLLDDEDDEVRGAAAIALVEYVTAEESIWMRRRAVASCRN